jgi:ketosteroid isomerase-like protein
VTDKADIENIVRACYTARQRNDADATLAFFHPEASFRIAGSENLKPLSQPLSGIGELRPVMERLVLDWDWSQFPIMTVLVDGDTAVVHSVGLMKHVPSGTSFDTEILDKVTLRDRKIIDLVEFADTQTVARAVGMA